MSAMTYESVILDYDDFPLTHSPVWILGTRYNVLKELNELREDVMSRLWFTYRKNFTPIGGDGPTYDTGWGCMLRCGQMMMSQALINRHLGRGWRWKPQTYDPKYQEILRLFQDKRSSCYSIHQIASMGMSEGKAIGEWFGPNTIAQVLKKLSAYDEWSSVVVHIALDNTVITDDIRKLCRDQQSVTDKVEKCNHADQSGSSETNKNSSQENMATEQINGMDDVECLIKDCTECNANVQTVWKPILLIIPLRLGLSEINNVYINSLKETFKLSQSVGIIGGRPNHAHWFIGFVEDELIYLDPHTTQPLADITLPYEVDDSYHCICSSRMRINHLDPSIALGFFCATEKDFDDLCSNIQNNIIKGEKTPMFELHKESPAHWLPFVQTPSQEGATAAAILDEDRLYDTDEEFELL